jgi:hypothetical protein
MPPNLPLLLTGGGAVEAAFRGPPPIRPPPSCHCVPYHINVPGVGLVEGWNCTGCILLQ